MLLRFFLTTYFFNIIVTKGNYYLIIILQIKGRCIHGNSTDKRFFRRLSRSEAYQRIDACVAKRDVAAACARH